MKGRISLIVSLVLRRVHRSERVFGCGFGCYVWRLTSYRLVSFSIRFGRLLFACFVNELLCVGRQGMTGILMYPAYGNMCSPIQIISVDGTLHTTLTNDLDCSYFECRKINLYFIRKCGFVRNWNDTSRNRIINLNWIDFSCRFFLSAEQTMAVTNCTKRLNARPSGLTGHRCLHFHLWHCVGSFIRQLSILRD